MKRRTFLGAILATMSIGGCSCQKQGQMVVHNPENRSQKRLINVDLVELSDKVKLINRQTTNGVISVKLVSGMCVDATNCFGDKQRVFLWPAKAPMNLFGASKNFWNGENIPGFFKITYNGLVGLFHSI